MKVFSLLCLVAFAAIPARAIDKVDLVVNVRTDGKAVTGKGASDEQKRFLSITLKNKTREDLSGLTVKWAIFATDLKTNDTSKAGSGDVKSSLSPQHSETIDGQTVSMNYTLRHAERTNSSKGGNNNKRGNTTVKAVEASGKRYRGWGVRVFQGGELVGEAYSTPELKDRM